ncbi:hypothetical protein V5N11_027160 [Cardamine amara subsp. amara]|uniref:Uncharacterized protein n=1 Tax=Cardamine amara subsp. amara TaxID=228776 RepID=A0ABD1AIM5_CARAN
MENSLVDSGETLEVITTDKTEETVKGILRKVKSQDDMDHGEAPVPETVAPAFPSSWKGFVTRLMKEEFLTVSMLMERVKAVEEQRITYSPAATGSSQMETRLSLGTTDTGLKRKEPERDIIIGDKGNESDERASKKPNQIPEYVGSETQARTNNED